jgi:hypothetical protein
MYSLSLSSTGTTLLSSSTCSRSTTIIEAVKLEEEDFNSDIDIHTMNKKPTTTPSTPRTPYKPRRGIFVVAVKEDGNIMLNDGSGPTRTITPRWFQDNHEDFFLACQK